jgi:gliding motility-associated protein GldC
MKQSSINFDVTLDKENIPEKISWKATDGPNNEEPLAAKAVSIALWDKEECHSLRIDLWTKDMPVDEMKRFYVETIAGVGENIQRATNDEVMANMIYNFCDTLVEYLKKSEDQQS